MEDITSLDSQAELTEAVVAEIEKVPTPIGDEVNTYTYREFQTIKYPPQISQRKVFTAREQASLASTEKQSEVKLGKTTYKKLSTGWVDTNKHSVVQ